MLVYEGSKILDRKLINLVDFLQEGDVLVFNDVQVIKAKLEGSLQKGEAHFSRAGKDSDNEIQANKIKIEFNLDQEIAPKIWRTMARKTKKIKDGDIIKIAEDFFVTVIKKLDEGFLLLQFSDEDYLQKLEKYGFVPLPPYIKREEKKLSDEKNYQTIYARDGLAVAAPTAGLHFTDKIFAMLDARKIKRVFVTLNVGAGTFMPVRTDRLQDHKMHEESFAISADAAKTINEAKACGSRIIAVGTTSLRVLESVADENGIVKAAKTSTKIFIYPPYKFKVVDALMTNFHLPKSTLFMLICAFVGKEKAHEIYSHAILEQYRFYSYGDASLLIPAKKIS